MSSQIPELGQEDQIMGPLFNMENWKDRGARSNAQAGVVHLNSVHQTAKAEYEIAIERNEEINRAQQVQNRQETEYLARQLHILRSEAVEEKAEGDGVHEAKECRKMAIELCDQAKENLTKPRRKSPMLRLQQLRCNWFPVTQAEVQASTMTQVIPY